MVEGLELTEILDPYMFDNHKDIVNALFEVYYDLSNEYLKMYTKQPTLNEQAALKLKLKFGLDK